MESRLATLTVDTDDVRKLSVYSNRPDLPVSFTSNISELVTVLPALFNTLNIRRSIIPSANGHCSARALARYYATLADGGILPPPHSTSSKPPLGSHPHIPSFPSQKTSKKQKGGKSKDVAAASNKTNIHEQNTDNGSRSSKDSCYNRKARCDNHGRFPHDSGSSSENTVSDNGHRVGSTENGDDSPKSDTKIFSNPRIHDAFLGVGEYENYGFPSGKFGLGFKSCSSKDGTLLGFGHSGMGGSTGYCDINNKFAIAVTLNKMSLGGVTGKIIQFICSELNLPVPEDYSRFSGSEKPEEQSNVWRPLINWGKGLFSLNFLHYCNLIYMKTSKLGIVYGTHSYLQEKMNTYLRWYTHTSI